VAGGTPLCVIGGLRDRGRPVRADPRHLRRPYFLFCRKAR
jgi:hypothetical protein